MGSRGKTESGFERYGRLAEMGGWGAGVRVWRQETSWQGGGLPVEKIALAGEVRVARATPEGLSAKLGSQVKLWLPAWDWPAGSLPTENWSRASSREHSPLHFHIAFTVASLVTA